MFKKNDKKTINAWAFYDWANSVYNLVITTAIFPLFYAAVLLPAGQDPEQANYVEFFGRSFLDDELYSYMISFSSLVVLLLMPILSGIADYKGNKKSFLKFFCYLGSASCISLYWFDANHLEISMLSPFFASIGFWGSLVFYNAYLPEIATKDQHDNVSAKGFAMGYIGSVILLVAILAYSMLEFGPIKHGFIAVGIWWAGFSQYTYRHLPSNKTLQTAEREKNHNLIGNGFLELKRVWKEVQQMPLLKAYLAAFFVFNMGVQTIMLLATKYAIKEIDWPVDAVTGKKDESGLIISIILIQLVAIVGAIVMSRLSKKFGNINVLKGATLIWCTVCLTAYYIHAPIHFYLLASIVGFVMGGTQALSRSTYAKILPRTHDHTSYFSFYDVLEKLGLVVGPLMFGIITGIAQGMRPSILMLITVFALGLILLFLVPMKKFKEQIEIE
jgi:MFS transporter, UMF1 family